MQLQFFQDALILNSTEGGIEMEYEGQICRSPMERGAFMLPVAAGCAYNACKFCMLFKHLSFRELPLEQIHEEILRVKALGGNPKKVFLGDGNAFGMDQERFLAILAMIREHFPDCSMVNMDATVTDISKKSDKQLHELYDAGVRRLYLGIESGLDDVLHFMNKDHSLTQAYEQIDRIHNAGMSYGAHIMTGIAGRGRGLENAEKTAEFFNRTGPEFIVNFSLFLHRRAPLQKDILSGAFVPASEQENILEARRLLELLDVPGVKYDGFHDMVLFRVKGILPHDRERMIGEIDRFLEKRQDLESRYAEVS